MQEHDRDFTKMWRMQHMRYALPSHIMGREAQRDRGAHDAPGGGVASGSRARIRTSVERTKTACPAWLDDPGMLRRKLYPAAAAGRGRRTGPAEGSRARLALRRRAMRRSASRCAAITHHWASARSLGLLPGPLPGAYLGT